MPTYDYQCRACGFMTEVIHSMLEEGPSTCERCGGALRRVLYPTGIIFKGSGFYRTDSRAGAGSGESATSTPASTSPSTKGSEGSSATSDKPATSDGGGKAAEPSTTP